MSASHFSSLDLTRLRRTLSDIHQSVTGGCGRVEVTRHGCDDVCIIISKVELESLERALEIFAESEDYKAMCKSLADLAGATCPPPFVHMQG